MSNIITNSDGMIEIYNGPELELKIKPNNFLEQCKTEIHRIGQKYPVPCKEMVKEVVDFICPKLDKPYEYLKNSEESGLISWKQRQFVYSLYAKCYVGQEFKFAEIWNKYAPKMIKEKGYICHVKVEEYSIF